MTNFQHCFFNLNVAKINHFYIKKIFLLYNTFFVQFNGLFTDDFNRVMYRLTGIETFLTAADCFYVQMNQITSLWISISTLDSTGFRRRRFLFVCVAQKKCAQVWRPRGEQLKTVWWFFWVAYLCWDWSRAPAPSTAIRRRPTAFSWPGTSEASPDCFTARCLESQSESGWFPYLWREEDTPVL